LDWREWRKSLRIAGLAVEQLQRIRGSGIARRHQEEYQADERRLVLLAGTRSVFKDGSTTPWSNTQMLGYGVQPQGGAPAPMLTMPANGFISAKPKINLSYAGSEGAMLYQVQISDSTSFTTTIVDSATKKLKLKVKLSAVGTYYWRVRAQYRDGSVTPWSSVYSMTYSQQASTGLDVPTADSGSGSAALTSADRPRFNLAWVLGLIHG
jgi:hypothetical protein